MASKILMLVGAAVAFCVFSTINGLRTNLRKARKTGLPYIIVRKYDVTRSEERQN